MTEKTLTVKQALHILLTHVGRDMTGAGRGIRMAPTDKQRMKAIAASRRMYWHVYREDPRYAGLENYGITEGAKEGDPDR